MLFSPTLDAFVMRVEEDSFVPFRPITFADTHRNCLCERTLERSCLLVFFPSLGAMSFRYVLGRIVSIVYAL